MTFEEAVDELRTLLGRTIAVNLTDERYGIAEGYLADFSGTLVRIDEPIPEVDAPVFYFRMGDESGFGLHKRMFRSAEWRTVAGQRELRIELDGVVILVFVSDGV